VIADPPFRNGTFRYAPEKQTKPEEIDGPMGREESRWFRTYRMK